MASVTKPVRVSFEVSAEKTQEFLSQKSTGGFRRSIERFKKYEKNDKSKVL